MWNKLEKLLLVLTCAVLAFTVGLIVGINNNSKIVEKLANENIVKERTIQQQKERIRELQEMKQLKEIYNA